MNNWIDILSELKHTATPAALITVTDVLGSAPCKIGSRMVVVNNTKFYGTIGGGKLEFEAIKEAVKSIVKNKIKKFTYTLGPDFEQCCGGKVTLLIEPMNTTPQLYICGAGHIGTALTTVLKNTPFQIHLLDTRENWFDHLNLDETVKIDNAPFDLYKQNINWGKNCYVLIMTHDHKLDFEITALALQEETKYIGLIGSKTKKNKFNNLLKKELNFEAGIAPVHCPVGLDIGGHNPQEIAISIAAELLKTYYEK